MHWISLLFSRLRLFAFSSLLGNPLEKRRSGTITNYMIVRLIVNDNDTSNNSYHNIGRVTGLQCNLDIAEIVAFNSKVSNADAALVEGYMAVKWGLTSALPSSHNYKSYTSWSDVLITTGQPVSLQILADRNPTSWSASGLASGLSINNSGLISGDFFSLLIISI